MVAADVHDSRQRLSGFQPHVDLMHAFIADWSDDDNVLGCGNGDDSMLARRISPREIGTPRDAERGAMVQLLASPLLPRTPVAVHTVNSPVSDADASTSTASTPSSPESDYGATAPHTLSPAVEAPPTAATIPPTAAASKGDKAVVPRRKRTLPKVEIAQLREQSRALEAQLLELREYWKSAPARIRKSSSAGTGSKSLSVIDEPIWQHAANQQRDMLSVSEAKNLALRAKYELNRKIVRALRKVLMKRRTSPATFDSALYLMPLRNPQQVFAESYSDFKTLLCDIKPMYADTARIEQLIASRLQRLDPQSLAFREWRLQNEHSASRGDTYIEAVDCYALPFDHMHVAAAMRHQHDALSSGNTNKRLCEFFERCDHSAMRQAIYAYKHPNQQGYVRNKDVTHFFHSATHSIIVSVTLIEPVTASGTPIAGIVLRERKWTIVRNEDDVGGGVGGDGATSLVCSYHKITCDRVAKEFEAHWTPAALIDAMAPAWSSTLTKARCELESRLIELSMDSRL